MEYLMFTPGDETGKGIPSAAPAQINGESDDELLPGNNPEPLPENKPGPER
jgi:hypothetical protein